MFDELQVAFSLRPRRTRVGGEEVGEDESSLRSWTPGYAGKQRPRGGNSCDWEERGDDPAEGVKGI